MGVYALFLGLAVLAWTTNALKEVQMENEKAFYEKLERKGVSRRDFMKYCTFLTAAMGLTSSFVPKVAEVFAAPAQRPQNIV